MKEKKLLSVALWSIRRLPTKHYKLTALRELEDLYTNEKEYETIMECIKQVQENGGF